MNEEPTDIEALQDKILFLERIIKEKDRIIEENERQLSILFNIAGLSQEPPADRPRHKKGRIIRLKGWPGFPLCL